MRSIVCILAVLAITGCGYTTKAFLASGVVYVKPVENKIQIAQETNAYSEYQSFPLLLEKRLTNQIVTEFTVRSGYTVVGAEANAERLESAITGYRKEALRYDDFDEITEQRLRLTVHIRQTIRLKKAVGRPPSRMK